MAGQVLLSEGTFDITATISQPTQSTLAGMGRGTILEIPSGTAVLPVIQIQGSAGSHIGNPVIKNLYITAAGSDANGGVLSDHVSYLRMYGVIIANMEGYALRTEATWDSEFVSCQFSNSGTASIPNVYILNASDDGTNNLVFVGCRFEGYDGVGVQIEQVSGDNCRALHFMGCKIHARSSPTDIDNFIIKGASNIQIVSCNFANSHTDHPDLIIQDSGSESPDENIILGNQFRSPSPTYHIDVQGGDRNIIDGNLFETEPDNYHIQVASGVLDTVIGSSNLFAAGADSKFVNDSGTRTRHNWRQGMAMSALTISSGAITVTRPYHSVTAETTAADDLDTINGGNDNYQLTLRRGGSYNVVIKNDTGNIFCGSDFTMDNVRDTVTLVYDSTLSKWLLTSSSSNA